MDYFSHGFWSYIFFHKTKRPLLAVIFGLMPDNLSWALYFLFNVFTGQLFGRPHPELVPDWIFTLYGISHSLILWLIAALVIYFVLKKHFLYLYAAPIAILMDVPTHSREFLPTPFLWPLSEWTFPGFSWGNGWFMLINYSLIVACFIYIARKNKKRK